MDEETGRKLNDYITGEIIGSRARKYNKSERQLSNPSFQQIEQYYSTLTKNAFCYVIRQLRISGSKKSKINNIHAEKIRVYADKHVLDKVTKGSSKHKIQNYRHSGNAYAVVLQPMRNLHN